VDFALIGDELMLHIIDNSCILYRILARLDYMTINGHARITSLQQYRHYAELLYASVQCLMAPDDRFVFCWDAPPYFRKDLLPAYKQGRPPKPDCFSHLIDAANDWDHLALRGFEADDIIAAVCQLYPDLDKLIWTVDTDLMQLIDLKTTWFNIVTPKFSPKLSPRARTSLNHHEWYINRGIGKKHWEHKNPKDACLTMKMNLGDKSDNYPGGCDPLIYDLSVSPVHGLLTKEMVESCLYAPTDVLEYLQNAGLEPLVDREPYQATGQWGLSGL
jgi:5'-3' exonuclease